MKNLPSIQNALAKQPEFASQKEWLEWVVAQFLEYIGKTNVKFDVVQESYLGIRFYDGDCPIENGIMDGFRELIAMLYPDTIVGWREYISGVKTVVISD